MTRSQKFDVEAPSSARQWWRSIRVSCAVRRVGVVLDEVAHPDACGSLCASQITSPLSIRLPVRAETCNHFCPRLPLLALDLLRMSAVGRVQLVFCGFELRRFSIGGECEVVDAKGVFCLVSGQ
jgi:hypothetical protein